MSVATQPSAVKAVVELLRGNATVTWPAIAALVVELQTLVGDRVDTEWRASWDKPDGRIFNAITVVSDGGFGVQRPGARAQGRVLLRCWATHWHVANQVAQLVSQILYPIDGQWAGWVAAGTRVDGVTGISEPVQHEDPAPESRRAMELTANLFYRRLAVAA